MTRREAATIATHFELLQQRMDEIRETTEAIRRGEINPHHGCNRIDKITRQVAKEK